jgi:hypothetical protein
VNNAYDPYSDTLSPPDRPPDPTQAACVLSRICEGYQTEDRTADGIILRVVWSGFVLFDGDLTHPVPRWWISGGGDCEYLETKPRIDRMVPERPR